jgi:hypothetical protein
MDFIVFDSLGNRYDSETASKAAYAVLESLWLNASG